MNLTYTTTKLQFAQEQIIKAEKILRLIEQAEQRIESEERFYEMMGANLGGFGSFLLIKKNKRVELLQAAIPRLEQYFNNTVMEISL